MPSPLIVIRLKQTCLSNPSQWQGRLEDGRVLYIRYRWGSLYAGVGRSLAEAVGVTKEPDESHVLQVGSAYDGYIELGEVAELLADRFDLSRAAVEGEEG